MRIALSILLALFLSSGIIGHKNVPAVIRLNDGEILEVYHFGQLNCSSSKFFDSSITLKGKYLGSHTETNDYSEINKLVLQGFTEEPVSSVGNQKGTITVYKKNGQSFDLEEAELYMACYGSVEKYNQIRVQMINPLTGKPFEKPISTKDIESITFK